MIPVIISPMTLADMDDVMAIEEAAFPTHWTRTTFERELTNTSNGIGHYYTVKPQSKIVKNSATGPEIAATAASVLCYGGFWLIDHEAHIVSIATHPQWRQHGFAKRLLIHMLDQARTRGATEAKLEVRVGNSAARTLYSNMGFVEVGKRKNYYPPTELLGESEDAMLLTLFSLATHPQHDQPQ